MRKLKHEGFKRGDIIRAWDFEPMPGRTNRYVTGPVLEVNRNGTPDMPFAHYRVEVVMDTAFPTNPRPEVFVPMEMMMMDWDTRVEMFEEECDGMCGV